MMAGLANVNARAKVNIVLVLLLPAILVPAAIASYGAPTATVMMSAAISLVVTLALAASLLSDLVRGAEQSAAAARRLAAGDVIPDAHAARLDEFGVVLAAVAAAQAQLSALRTDLKRLAAGETPLSHTNRPPGVFGELSTLVAEAAGGVHRVGSQAERVAQAARDASAAVGLVSEGAQEQHEDLDLVATAIGQSAQAIASVSDSTRSASDMVKAASGSTARGKEEMARLLTLAETIAENSRRIGRITEAITQIAVKTNILSVNASIEAARAGEQGKGFEVVAEEVGKLADNAVESARQIREIVETAVTMAEEGMSATSAAVRLMDDVADRVGQVDRMFHSIAVAMEEQQTTIKDIEANVTNIRSVASKNATASERITSTMQELARLAEDTRTAAAQLKAVN